MSDKAKQDMIDNFIGITGVTRDRAQFYLESSAWNLELAMASFYEGDPADDVEDIVDEPVNVEPPPAVASASRPTGKSGSSKSGASSRFATIGSMKQDDDSDSDDNKQAFYAGGSDRSGQQVLGPKKKNKNIVEDLFKSAREHGAEEVGDEAPEPTSRPTFQGSGYRLGETDEQPSVMVQGKPVMKKRQQVDCVLKLWKNGFSVDDGPLRDFKDPANSEFLAAISKGEVPQELIREAKGGEVNLNMEDHRQEDYVKPKVAVKAFSGEGHTLGSPVPNVVTSPSPASGSSEGTSVVQVNDSKPSTTIQIRLADGSRLISKFNHSHSVGDIRRHITSSRPQYAAANFILQTTFPNRELTNDSETIEQAKLLNAVVVQRLK